MYWEAGENEMNVVITPGRCVLPGEGKWAELIYVLPGEGKWVESMYCQARENGLNLCIARRGKMGLICVLGGEGKWV